MQTLNHLFQRELSRLLVEEIERLKDMVSKGHAASFDEYKWLAGQVAGLEKAIEYMADANANVERD